MVESSDTSIKVILPADRSREDKPPINRSITRELADALKVDEVVVFHRLNRMVPTKTIV